MKFYTIDPLSTSASLHKKITFSIKPSTLKAGSQYDAGGTSVVSVVNGVRENFFNFNS